jgi:taurine dioxygenase
MCSDRRGGSVKPLIYTHPRSGLDTLCFHLGMTAAFIWDYGTTKERLTGPSETQQLLDEMEDVFTKAVDKRLIYKHSWVAGDFIISDNAALGHEASVETQASVEQVGLRVMHRTTVQGSEPPRKKYEIDTQGIRIKTKQ